MASQVTDFYNGKNIFITGGTGFLGVCLIEKLLRCCPDVKNIYLLIRPKKGLKIEERLQDLTKNSVFNRLQEENKTDLLKKLIPIAGDVGQESLGLSPEDKATLINNVQIVFHSAATLDFEADLKSTANINLLGTRRVVQLCQEIKDLKALVHVSSAYVNSVLQEVNEHIYPSPADVSEVLKQVKEMDDAALIELTPKILKDHPNPYTFTKHLAEHEVVNGRIPATIVRPSMITGAWKEPVPGWTISKNGPQGFIMGASKGVIRRLPIAKTLTYDYIPVDIVVNALIVAAYSVNRDGSKEVKIYHCTSSTTNPFKWINVEKKVNDYLHEFPLNSAVWYPYLKFLPSLFWFRISALFVHMIPAYILDTVTKLCGGRPILVRMHTNVNSSLNRLENFIFREWKFNSPQMAELYESLSPDDKKTFDLDIKPLDWEDYFRNLARGIRMYLHKESPKSLGSARTKDKILLVAHITLQVLILGLIWWLTKTLLGSTWIKTSFMVPLMHIIFDSL